MLIADRTPRATKINRGIAIREATIRDVIVIPGISAIKMECVNLALPQTPIVGVSISIVMTYMGMIGIAWMGHVSNIVRTVFWPENGQSIFIF